MSPSPTNAASAIWPAPRPSPSTTPGGWSASTAWGWSRSGRAWRASSTTTSASPSSTSGSRSTVWWSSTTAGPCRTTWWHCEGDVRNLVEELRDALVDLRSDVSETQGVDDVLRSFLERVKRRNRMAVTLTADAEARLPLSVEREFWRVAQEAVMNAERHAHASNVSVLWLCNADGALLEVSDNGVGISAGKAAGASSYGLLGMRERADSVGAQLDITSGPDRGTVVRMRMRVA